MVLHDDWMKILHVDGKGRRKGDDVDFALSFASSEIGMPRPQLLQLAQPGPVRDLDVVSDGVCTCGVQRGLVEARGTGLSMDLCKTTRRCSSPSLADFFRSPADFGQIDFRPN